jgi:hypothetical protein
MRISLRAPIWIPVALVIVLAGALLFGRLPPSAVPLLPRSPAPPPAATPPPAAAPARPAEDPIDGERVPVALAGRRPIAVIVENYPQARPQWGLSQAVRVYEAITEGGVTRYLAIFGEKDADRVGPVRSARTQFLSYVVEVDAPLAHVGGNADALDLIAAARVKDLDQFRYAGAYRRLFRPGLAYEHTVFTSTTALRDLANQKGWGETIAPDPPAWKDDNAPDRRPANQRVTINFSGPQYAVLWVYRPSTNDYQRFLAGQADTDAANERAITAKVVAAAVVPRTHGRTRIREDTWTFADIGSGKAWIFQDGMATAGTWKKRSRTDRLLFFDQDGNEVVFIRGPQWMEIIPPEVSPVF